MKVDIDCSTVKFLIGRFIDTEFNDKFLANVCQETFSRLKEDLQDRFVDLELTDTDIKDCWKEWFDWATTNGTLVSPGLVFTNADRPYMHDELQVHDLILLLANQHIDQLN